ncbi:hypothetical protein Hanom_Chr08g00690041 [Helianthus anomalus]
MPTKLNIKPSNLHRFKDLTSWPKSQKYTSQAPSHEITIDAFRTLTCTTTTSYAYSVLN